MGSGSPACHPERAMLMDRAAPAAGRDTFTRSGGVLLSSVAQPQQRSMYVSLTLMYHVRLLEPRLFM